MIDVPIGSQTNHKAEVLAALQGILLTKRWNFPYIWIEGDSNNIIKCLKGTFKPSWSINNIIKATRDLINTFEKSYMSHIYREVNGSTDWAANAVVNQDEMITWKGEQGLLEDVRLIILRTDKIAPQRSLMYKTIMKWIKRSTSSNYNIVSTIYYNTQSITSHAF